MTTEPAPLPALTRLLMIAEEQDNYGEDDGTAEALRDIHAELAAQLDRTAATLRRVVGENELLREQCAELHAATNAGYAEYERVIADLEMRQGEPAADQ